jgi:Glycosyltransferase Family 4
MSLRILITNNTLAARAGTEIYVRDIAMALLNRGHSPVAYSSLLGEVAQELRAATVPVIDRLDALAVRPDLIHGHHHLETMTALLQFPDVPAISFCHGWLPWEEMPPKFPRILRYVAVDETCRDRLVLEHAIPEERVRLLLNFVDLKRFKSRMPLPVKPRRALVFSNYASEDNILPTIRTACVQSNVSVDSIGIGSKNTTSRPEDLLPDYDLAFAKGRAALEALAVGTAVILCDTVGVGPLVTTENMERLRKLNFGIRTLRSPMEPGILSQEIARYNAVDAAQVSAWIRQTAGMESALDDLGSLYEDVVAEYRQLPAPDPATELRAASTYLRHWVWNLTAQHEARIQHEHLKIDYQRQRQEFYLAKEQHRELREKYDSLEDRHRQLCSEQQQQSQKYRDIQEQYKADQHLQAERYRQLQESYERQNYALDGLRGQYTELQAERQRLQSDLIDVFSSPTLRLRNQLVELPLVGTWLKSLARLAAGRVG